jgi:preprotein translocase subunit SecF
MNIIKNRYWYFAISLLVIIPGLIFMVLQWRDSGSPLLLGVDFTGGSLLEVQFASTRPAAAEITTLYAKFSTADNPLTDPIVQPLGEDSYSIRSKQMDDATKGKMVTEMETLSGGTVTVLNFTSVSAAIGTEVTRAAGFAILRFGAAAVIAMLHDVFVVVGVEAILGYFLHWEADALFLTALLTVIGFSVHDTIVVFDRVRENSIVYRRVEFEKMVNHSIIQTLDRSINTQLTVMFTLTALALFGGDSIRHFVIILLVGIFSGTYSSIFNASPILVVWQNKEWRNWFRPKATA